MIISSGAFRLETLSRLCVDIEIGSKIDWPARALEERSKCCLRILTWFLCVLPYPKNAPDEMDMIRLV